MSADPRCEACGGRGPGDDGVCTECRVHGEVFAERWWQDLIDSGMDPLAAAGVIRIDGGIRSVA